MSKHYIREDLKNCPEFAKKQIKHFQEILEFWKGELKRIENEKKE